jgi:hypothetical protein
MKNLIVVPAGDQSLHECWHFPERNFDLWVIYFGDNDAIAQKYQSRSDRFFRAKGLKYSLYRQFLLGQYFQDPAFFDRYPYIWLPDDDLRFLRGPQDVNRMFDVCAQIQADVFQPALGNELVDPVDFRRYYSRTWESTLLIGDAKYHRVNIVEIMMHGFSLAAFKHCFLPALHSLFFSQAGWGIEPVIMKHLEVLRSKNESTYVLDCVPVIHMRPVSVNGSLHQIGQDELRYLPHAHTYRMQTLEVVY